MSLLSPRNRGSIYSRMATWSDFRRAVGGIIKMDSSDWSNVIRHHAPDTRSDTEFKLVHFSAQPEPFCSVRLIHPSHTPHTPLMKPSYTPHTPLIHPSYTPHTPLTHPSYIPHTPLIKPSYTPNPSLTHPSYTSITNNHHRRIPQKVITLS
jgi:hypothetical protein